MSVVLPSQLHTPDQFGRILLELRNYTSKLRDRAVRRQVADIVGEEMPPLSSLSNKVLEANGVTPAKGDAIDSLVQQLETLRKGAPVAHLTLVELPDSAARQELADWFRNSVHPHVLLTFAGRSDIGGGFLLRVGARQYDCTFRSQLLANKNIIGKRLHGPRK